ncbi:hypothetical protein [Acidimangrovimonas pyrenivorans]|uniref:Uncharacterized protein n=1 Tax=Acidimangrovimonas pyrenivorans TaxID=2030798 RepID=A0ABV7AEF0_9RHOB
MEAAREALAQGARNLLVNCAGLGAGDAVVICHEAPEHGWYDDTVAEAVAHEALRLGLTVSLRPAPPPGEPAPEPLRAALTGGNVIYFARIGDQGRFAEAAAPGRQVMVYARRAPDLASEFGRVDHRAMAALKAAVDAVLFAAAEIEITCPLGTRVTGRVTERAAEAPPADVSVRRFPLGVPAPVPAAGFEGRVVLAGTLTSTGNRPYSPAVLPLPRPVTARFAAGRITGFEGADEDVAAVEAHYRHVAGLFGLDPFTVHSWHAGLHPGCRYFEDDGRDSELWSNAIFSNPKVLHFHSCGREAPGEVCWNVIDPTVTVDGCPLWRDGRLFPRKFAAIAQCLDAWPELDSLFT